MVRGARYAHTNMVARDYVRLAEFYEALFGCVPVPPERNYAAAELERGTAIPGAGLRGRHLRLPGHGDSGPTLEVFQYEPAIDAETTEVHRPGFGHIAFAVEDVTAAHAEVLANGGSVVGEIVELQPAPGRTVTWCYVRDPEGNVIELQSWSNDA